MRNNLSKILFLALSIGLLSFAADARNKEPSCTWKGVTEARLDASDAQLYRDDNPRIQSAVGKHLPFGLPVNASDKHGENLHRLYRANQVAIVRAVATPYRERSHFDDQDVLESGLAKPGATDSGWLNRALATLEPAGRAETKPHNIFAVGPMTPLVVRGTAPVLSWTPPKLPPATDDTVMRLLDLYRHTDPALARVMDAQTDNLARELARHRSVSARAIVQTLPSRFPQCDRPQHLVQCQCGARLAHLCRLCTTPD